jgi:hypothetical protein
MRLVACITLLFAASASAQTPEPPASSEIVVTGTRDRETQVRDFVGALTQAPGGSIPRFIDAVCPAVSGLGPTQKEAVVTRLRAVATAAAIPVGPAACVPNMFVIVTPDKRTFIELLARKRPQSFGLMSAREIARLARTPGPAAAWQLEGPVTVSGVPLQWDDTTGAYINSTTEAASRITTVGRRGFDAAALVVEVGALEGITSVQLADYAAMRLFAKVNPARLPNRAPTTILTLLTTPMGSPVPITMSKWDLGLLRGLYAVTPNLAPSAQRSQIARQVVRDLNSDSKQHGR